MIGIALRFAAGRFHATPWGRHVNEGAPEWPPSPWRLLRSLVAVWKMKVPNLSEVEVRSVLQQLAAPPCFYLPPATTGHTRHYMRWNKKEPPQTLVFDAFVCLDRDSEVAVLWPDAKLDAGHRQVLTTLLKNLAYLGRRESWCEARMLDQDEAQQQAAQVNCRPLNGDFPGANQELVQILCADPEIAFDSEHVEPVGTGKSRSKRPLYDPAWHLCVETGQLHAEKWSDPPGSKWITHVRPAACFDPPPKPRSRPHRDRLYPQVIRYALDSNVLPLVTETLPIAEQARLKLMGIYGRITERNGTKGRSPTLSGKDAEGRPLVGHGHAYYLPTDEDGDGRLDHLTIVAEDGFNREEMQAFDRLRSLKPEQESSELNLLLTGGGRLKDFRSLPVGESSHWVSATPFLVTRHPKKRGRKRDPAELLTDPHLFIVQVLREEIDRWCERHGKSWRSDAVEIEPLYGEAERVFRIDPKEWSRQAGPRLRPIQFKRFRRKHNDDGGRRLTGTFRLRFPEPVCGPISLGIHSHFGLGLFLPAKEE